MGNLTRRDVIKAGAGVAVTAAVAGSGLLPSLPALARPSLHFEPEKGASLRYLRHREFVRGDIDLWMQNTEKFTKATGVPVRVDRESFEDTRPKAAVAANVGSGPDIIVGWYDDPHLYPDKLLDLTDLATYLGNKYGGWYPVAETYGTRDSRWIGLPLGCGGVTLNYRISAMRRAGFDTFPTDLDGFLKLCHGLHKIGLPPGFALGNAVGDANT